MNKFFIIEARRLLPLAFLLALLVSLSVYDNFFRMQPVEAPLGTIDEDFVYVTATRGEIDAPADFMLVHTNHKWDKLQDDPKLDLPDYPFNEAYEVALCTINSKVDDVIIKPSTEDITGEVAEVTVKVKDRPQYYHLVMVNRDQWGTSETHWRFVDEEGEEIHKEIIEGAATE